MANIIFTALDHAVGRQVFQTLYTVKVCIKAVDLPVDKVHLGLPFQTIFLGSLAL